MPTSSIKPITDKISNNASVLSRVNYTIKITVGILLVFGIIMVYSASSISQYASASNPLNITVYQLFTVIFGITIAMLCSRFPLVVYSQFATALIIFFDFANVYTAIFGIDNHGNKNWAKLFGFVPSFQYSETLKLAICVYIAISLYKYQMTPKHLLNNSNIRFNRVILPILLITIGIVAVIFQKDMGTLMVIGLIIIGQLFISGVKLRYIFTIIVFATIGFVFMLMIDKSRIDKITAIYTGCSKLPDDTLCYQQEHSIQAFVSGGLLGKGPGQSREKWLYLPEPHTDFIFSIIGEEFGFFGSITVIMLYVFLILALISLIRFTKDIRIKSITSGITVWIFVQLSFNICVTIGILPVFGVTLPFISYGGSSLISLIIALGVIMSFITDKKHIKYNSRYIKKIRSIEIID